MQKVKLQLQWKHQFEFAGIYAAIEKGYYKEVGLEVELVEFSDSIDITQEVVKGNAEYALSYSSIIAEYMNGAPIVMLANFFKQSPLVLVAQKEIKTPKDLKNKKIMGLSNNIHNLTLFSMLNKFDIKSEEIIHIKNKFSIDDFVNKKVDAMSVFTTNELYQLDKKGVEYNIFDPVVYGSKYYDVNLFTSEKELLSHPDRVKKMRAASIKGWEYALNNQSEIVELILRKYNTQNKSRDSLVFEAKQIEYIMLRNVYDVGSIDIGRVKDIRDSFIEAGFIEDAHKKDINDFIYKDQANPLGLSKKELLFIKQQPKIVLGTDRSWEPYVIVDADGKISGYDVDVLTLINEISGLNIVLKAGNWKEMQEEAKKRVIDGLSTGGVHKERELYLNFSDIYVSMQKMIITSKENEHKIQNINDLENRVVAIHKSNLVDEKIAKKLKNSTILRFDNTSDVIMAVVTGKADAAFGNGATFYQANKMGAPYIRYSGVLDEELNLAFGIRNDWPEAIGIINKSLEAIGSNRLLELKQKWFYSKEESQFDYELFWKFLGALLVVVFILLYRHYTIKKLNRELERRVEEELKKSKDKDTMIFHQSKLISMGEMIENIAHQWRQPLSQINSAVIVLDNVLDSKGIEDESIEESLLEIESLTMYMSKTIDDFKNFYSEEKHKENFLLADLVDKSLGILKGTFKSHNIEIVTDFESIYFMHGYVNELEQVLIVILNNAKDAVISRDIKNPKITVLVKKKDAQYIIEIHDNAGGIDEKIIDKVFDPYFSTKDKKQGSGLGLYISKMIVEDSLNGTLRVSNTNEGACFTLTLKVAHD